MKIKQLWEAFKFAKKQSITMRRRMMLYFLCLAFALFGLFELILLAGGVMFNSQRQVQQDLELRLGDVGGAMDENLELLAGHTALLEEQLSKEIDNALAEGKDIHSLNDDPEALLELQKAIYPILNTSLQVSRSSGVYAVLDATTNTGISGAESSRSGMYLRLININGNVSLAPNVIYFRGIPDIAREKGLELHNRWNLEFDVSKMPWYEEQQKDIKPRDAENCGLTERIALPKTWEKAVFVSMPIIGKNGEVYGNCGLELSSLCFRLFYPTAESPYGSAFPVLAPVQDGKLLLAEGITGEQIGTVLSNDAILSITKGRYFDTFETESNSYIGLWKTLRLTGYDGREWAAAILVPKAAYLRYVSRERYMWMGIVLGFVLVMIAASSFMSKRFVEPIVKKLDTIREGKSLSEENSGISEIDELVAFLKSGKNDTEFYVTDLPANIEDLFERFGRRAEKLSVTERTILNYYLDGYEIGDIPNLMSVSISTVRTHNRNIYKKMGVASRDELMLYLNLMKRSGRIDKLGETEKHDMTEERKNSGD